MEDRVIYRFLWWPKSIGFGKPPKWLVFKGIVRKYREPKVEPTGGHDLFGTKAYSFSGGYWYDSGWHHGAINEPKLTPGAVAKGLLWSVFTLLSFFLFVFVVGRISWVIVPAFWEALSYFGIMLFDFFFGWLI